MSYAPVKFEQFGGLNVVDDPEEVGAGGAVDILNVDPNELPSRIVSRPGFTSFSPRVATPGPILPFPLDASHGDQVMVGDNSGPSWNVYNTAGSSIVTQGVTALGGVAALGTPTATRVYCLSDSAYYYDTSFHAITAPRAAYAAVTPVDNRVVGAFVQANDPSGAGTYPSRVRFSDTPDQTVWSTNNYVDLHPGDGHAITGLAVYGNDVYALKSSGTLYRFYGTTTDATGNPVFNYQIIRTQIGRGLGLTAAADGVYIVGTRGMFRFSGSGIEYVSRPIEPLFENKSVPYYQGQEFGSDMRILTPVGVGDYVYLLIYRTPEANGVMYVYSTRSKVWSYYAPGFIFGAGSGIVSAAPYQPNNEASPGTNVPYGGRVLMLMKSTGDLYFMGGTTDPGAVAITTKYRTGFYDLGETAVKRTRETGLEGIGTVTLKQSTDWGALDSGTSVTLGTSPTPAGKLIRSAKRGRMFSHELSGMGTWSVNRVVQYVADKRPAGLSS